MRLIDAGDILDSIENWKRKVLYYHPYTKKFTTIPLSEVLAFLEDSPTIDAVPVKHGEWIDPAAADCYRCSVCEEYTHMEMPRLLYHYCPNCGARMEGGKDNE